MTTTPQPPRGTLYALERPDSVLFPPRPAVVALDGLWVLTKHRRRFKVVPSTDPRKRGTTSRPSVVLVHFDLRDDDTIDESAADALGELVVTFDPSVLNTNAAEMLRPYDPGTAGNEACPAWVVHGLAARPVIVEMIPASVPLIDWRTRVDQFEADREERRERLRREREEYAVADAVASRVTDFARSHGMATASAHRTNGHQVRVDTDVLTYLLDHFRPAR